MARVLKKPGNVLAPVEAPLTPETTAEVRQTLGTVRRRMLKEKEHPAVAQFSDPEAKARVRERLAVNPNLLPSAFSHRPGREGCELTAIEASRVMSGKSIKVTGFCFDLYGFKEGAMCLKCYLNLGRPSEIPGKGYTIAMFDGQPDRLCMYCGTSFKGER